MSLLKPVIMAGGTGTRLWPLSRAAHPKQFLSLYNEDTMLQATVKRLSSLNINSYITICNEEHRFFVAEQFREIGEKSSIILEPEGRNTAPAVALAALSCMDEDPILLILAADHVINDHESFINTINRAMPLAEDGRLVTFGVIAHEPNIGYGYIEKGNPYDMGYEVKTFIEKPVLQKAKQFIDSGNYFWNSGIFLIKKSRYLEELKKFRRDIYDICEKSIEDTARDNDFLRINKEVFNSCPSESIDYAVMEKTDDAIVVPMDVGWSDVGSWSSLWNISEKDSSGNVTVGDTLLHDCRNSFVRSEEKFVTAIGLDDIVIVSTKDALVVSHKDSVENIKYVVNKIKSEARPEWELHREVYRPWGKFDSVDSGVGYKVKRLTVNPGAKLSVQKHFHRSEHWVVVAGIARVHYETESFDLNVNESTYHGKETIHALENPGDSPLEVIEVQVGSYLGEDDIVRFNDKYGRV